MTTPEADCLFCKIAAGDIPADIVYQDERVIAFRDISPKAPVHVLVIPKDHVPTINDLEESHDSLVGQLFLGAKAVARQEGVDDEGYRVVMNCNAGAGQTVFHIHLHVLGGRQLSWPPG